MKRTYFHLAIVGSLLATSAFAGDAGDFKAAAPTPPPVCGTGWYFALDGGANVYQDFGGDKHLFLNGDDLSVGLNDHIGGFGGIKLGYVFGQGTIRWAWKKTFITTA